MRVTGFTRPRPRVMTTVSSYYRGRGEGLVKPPGSHAESPRDASL